MMEWLKERTRSISEQSGEQSSTELSNAAVLSETRQQTISRWTKCADDSQRVGSQYTSEFPDEFKQNERWHNIMKPIEVALPKRWEDVTTEIIEKPNATFVEV